MTDHMESPEGESKPRTKVFITDWKGSVQSTFIFYPPEIKRNHTLNIVIGPDGTIAREEDLEEL